MVVWVGLIVHSNSTNDALWIKSWYAEINFYQSDEYDQFNDARLYDNYSSPSFPVDTIYKNAKVSLSSNPSPTPVTVTVNNITVHSH